MASPATGKKPKAHRREKPGPNRRGRPASQRQAVRSPVWPASSGASLKIPAPPLKPVSASAASTTAAAVQLDRSRGNGAWLANCQPVQ